MDLKVELSRFGPEEKQRFWNNVSNCCNDESWCKMHRKHGIDYINLDKNLVAVLVYQEMYKKRNFLEPEKYELTF